MTAKFTAYEHEITRAMQGDREEETGWEADPIELGDFDTLEEAKAMVEKYAKADKVETHRTRYGIGSITRPVYEVCKWAESEEDEDEVVYKLDVLDLHREYADAWEKAKKAFWKFLDYEDNGDGYGDFTDYLEEA